MGDIPSTTRWPGMDIWVTTCKDGLVSSNVISVASNGSPAIPWGYCEDGFVRSKTRSWPSTSNLASGKASTASRPASEPLSLRTKSPLDSMNANRPDSPNVTGCVIPEAEFVGPTIRYASPPTTASIVGAPAGIDGGLIVV
jgi:hypothetical protein